MILLTAKATSDALSITGVGMTAIFIFMAIFYISIRLIVKYFPSKEE